MCDTKNIALKLDIYVLLKQFKIGNFLGITPMFFDNTSHFRIVLWKSYVAALLFLYLSLSVLSLKWKNQIYSGMKITQIIINSAQCFSASLFVTVCLVGTLKNSNHWKLLLSGIKELEDRLQHTHFEVQKSLLLNNANVFFYHVIFFLVRIYEALVWIRNGQAECLHQFDLWILYVARMFRRRYDFLFVCLNDILIGKSVRNSSKSSNISVNEIYYLHKTLYGMVQHFNNIFGWQIFFILECTVLEILDSINFVLWSVQSDNVDLGVLIINSVYSTVYITQFLKYSSRRRRIDFLDD
ncbi:hypothetical protein NQ317_016412 [Molorchus minor]|uniref:Gustatory receptor n=1 Tax=Molorchus minor TaxID=1323400 RepID=A0ABQ9JXU9_9CUCU|nr:hypothetical protein NQ317_016412 [Molorchus minor]